MGKKELDRLKLNSIKYNTNLALNWLVKSGIQNNDKNRPSHFGAFNAWYDVKNRKYSYMYSEITGYLITSMIFHYRLTQKKIYLNSAIKAADWLIKNAQHKNGGFKCLFLINKKLKFGNKGGLYIFF